LNRIYRHPGGKPGAIVEQQDAAKWVPAFAGTTEERFSLSRFRF